MRVPREGWTAVPDGTRSVSARRRPSDFDVAQMLAAEPPPLWPEPAPAARPRVALVGRLPGVRRRRLLTRAYDISAFGAEEATELADAGFEVVLLDAALGTRGLNGVLAPLAERNEGARPAVLLVMRDGTRPRFRPAYQAVIDDVVAAGLGERQLLARVQSAVRVRGWMTELSRKNAELQTLYGRLEILASRMAEELRLASNVQRSLLPAPLQHARLDVAREFIPFREIGGDLYDFVPLGPHKMAFAIGDVMGKGVPAALLAANLKASIRAQVEAENICPSALVAKVNRMFWDVVPNGLFASLFFGVFDLEASVLEFVNAGHHYPFLVTAKGEVRDLVQGGTVLGLVEDSTYEQGAMAFHADDLFVFYSDGITDRANPEGELFGVERLKEAAARSGTDCSARICLYSLLGEVQGWSAGAPAEDDMTLVVARAR
ncbi:MAG TPA: PP2C family protein-serine/threonine phosphatase [Vicinamibacteria bacterium]|nr:PP2C family protein-serine/threonine phosphatase [Vicinamibacteria bacterium]